MEYLESGSRLKHFFIQSILEKGIREQAKPRSYAFAAYVNHIPERVIKPCRLRSEGDVAEHMFQSGIYV